MHGIGKKQIEFLSLQSAPDVSIELVTGEDANRIARCRMVELLHLGLADPNGLVLRRDDPTRDRLQAASHDRVEIVHVQTEQSCTLTGMHHLPEITADRQSDFEIAEVGGLRCEVANVIS